MKTADISGKRQNRAMGAVTTAERAEIEHGNKLPEHKVPPHLDPRVFDHRVGLGDDDATDSTLDRARRAYSHFGERLRDWHARERTIFSNQYETPQKRRMLASQMVRDEMGKGSELPTEAYHDCRRAIEGIDREIDKAFRNRLKTDEAREIRGHLKTMSKDERRSFLRNADDDVTASVLSAKPFLSGLSDSEAERLRFEAVQKWFPEQMQRRAKLEKAQSMIDDASQTYFAQAQEMVEDDLSEFETQADAMAKAIAGER